jgi:hypothetical protein
LNILGTGVRPPNEMRISCRPSSPCPHKLTFRSAFTESLPERDFVPGRPVGRMRGLGGAIVVLKGDQDPRSIGSRDSSPAGVPLWREQLPFDVQSVAAIVLRPCEVPTEARPPARGEGSSPSVKTTRPVGRSLGSMLCPAEVVVRPPNDWRISCRRSRFRPHKLALPLNGHGGRRARKGAPAWLGLSAACAC